MKIKACLPLLFPLSFCYHANATPTEPIKIRNIHNLTMNNDVQLGSGYVGNSFYPIQNQCLKDMPIKMSGFNANIALSHSSDTDKLAKNLNVDIKTTTGWGKFKASAAADYIKAIQSDDYSSSFTYYNVITVDTLLDTNKYYGENALNEGGLAAYEKDPERFYKRCGDQYIKGLRMGAVLNITLKIHFASQLEKKTFDASIDGSLGDLLSVSGKLNQAAAQNGMHGSVEVMAYQAGGSPNYLSQIFGSDENHAIIACKFSQMDKCEKAIDDFLSYAQGSGKWSSTGFAKQIQIINKELIAESLAPIGLSEATIGSYEDDFGLDIPIKPATEEVLQARIRLNTLYDQIYNHFQFATSLLESAGYKYLGENAREQIRTIIITIKSNLGLFNSEKAINCFLPKSQELCPMIAETIEKKLNHTDLTALNLLKGAYYVNLNLNWPVIMVKNSSDSLDFYSTNLNAKEITTHNLRLTPSYDYQYISLGGGYSYYDNDKLIRYYFDYYGTEDIIYKNTQQYSYIGKVPFVTCADNKCAKTYYPIEIVPF